MIILLIIISFLIIISKFFDCYTTLVRITHYTQEKNLLARRLMKKYGIKQVIISIFIINLIIVGISLYLMLFIYNTLFWQIIYIIISLVISILQFAVSHTNHTRKLNIFTKWIMKFSLYK